MQNTKQTNRHRPITKDGFIRFGRNVKAKLTGAAYVCPECHNRTVNKWYLDEPELQTWLDRADLKSEYVEDRRTLYVCHGTKDEKPCTYVTDRFRITKHEAACMLGLYWQSGGSGTFDTAIPVSFYREFRSVTGVDPRFGIVWRYEDGAGSYPYPITRACREALEHYNEALGTRYPTERAVI